MAATPRSSPRAKGCTSKFQSRGVISNYFIFAITINRNLKGGGVMPIKYLRTLENVVGGHLPGGGGRGVRQTKTASARHDCAVPATTVVPPY